MNVLRAVPVLLLPAFLAWACAPTRDLAAWEQYDGCATQLLTFSGMVGCGKDRLNAYCETRRSAPACGPLGNAVSSYADSLDKMIETKQITDQMARRRWAQFELLSPDEQIRTSQAAAAAVAR